jgi:hypothetical protein
MYSFHARPQSQFPHSCVCEWFLLYIPRIRPNISCSRIGRSIVGIYNRSQAHECGNLRFGDRMPLFLHLFFLYTVVTFIHHSFIHKHSLRPISIWIVAAQSFFWEYLIRIFGIGFFCCAGCLSILGPLSFSLAVTRCDSWCNRALSSLYQQTCPMITEKSLFLFLFMTF